MSEGPFTRRASTWIVGVSLASLAIGFGLGIFQDEVAAPPSAGADTYSVSALGHQALLELLEALHIPAVRHRKLGGPPQRGLLVIAEPGSDPDRLLPLLERSGPTLVILPKRVGRPSRTHPGWVEAAPESDWNPRNVLMVLGLSHALGAAGGPVRSSLEATPTIVRPQLLEPEPGDDALVTMGEGALLLEVPNPQGPGRLFILSDPDPLANHGIDDGDNAVFAISVLEHLGAATGTVIFDETTHGHGLRVSLWRELFRFPLALVSLQVLLATCALVWAGAVRFGQALAPPPPIEPGKGYLIRNTAALLRQGRHSGHVLARYLDDTMRRVAEELHAPSGLDAEARLEHLARLARDRPSGVEDPYALAERAEALEDAEAPARAIVASATAIHRFREDMTRGS